MSWIWVYVVLTGLGNGASWAIASPLRGRYWGRKAYATIQGAMLPFSTGAGMIGPVYAGWAYNIDIYCYLSSGDVLRYSSQATGKDNPYHRCCVTVQVLLAQVS